MTQQQDVLETRRPKRRALGVLLLGMIPLAVAGTAGAAASRITPEPEATTIAMPERVDAAVPTAANVAPVVAPGSADTVDLTVDIPVISVSFPPPPEPEPVLEPVKPSTNAKASGSTSQASKPSTNQRSGKASGSTSSGSKSSGSKSSGSKGSGSSGKSFTAYCASVSANYSAGGSAKGLLQAANKERARIGVGPLSWNGSLASAATAWSKSMASKDANGSSSALAHNPNRPGAENVARSSSSGGMPVGNAISRAHTNWMYSPGHCQNIMNPAYSQMGAGAAANANGTAVYTTANFR